MNVDQAVAAMLGRVDATVAEGSDGFPVYADPATGLWTRSDDGFWTGGFWCGMLWLAGQATGEARYRTEAARWTVRLRGRADSDTALRGFLFWYGAAIGSILAGDEEARGVALAGAAGLASSYQDRCRLIPLGNAFGECPEANRVETNIDGVAGVVALLTWASEQTEDHSLRQIAHNHAARHVEVCVRPDGSVSQSASIDPVTGELLRRYTQKGLNDRSTWSRAQAWAMLGFAHAAHRISDEFTDVALRVADWWVQHLPESGIAPWDFDDHNPAILDTSATGIAAAALLTTPALDSKHGQRYQAAADRMVTALVAHHLTPTDLNDRRPPGMLVDGCYDHRTGRATSHELIWGDYFLLETLLRITGHLDQTGP